MASVSIMAQAAPTLASYRWQQLLVFLVMDERHALVVGRNHLFQQVLDQLGIDNLWQGETNFWGTAVVGIEKLIALAPSLAILLEQDDDGALRRRISKTPLWQAIPFVRQQSWRPALRFGITAQPWQRCVFAGCLSNWKGSGHENRGEYRRAFPPQRG